MKTTTKLFLTAATLSIITCPALARRYDTMMFGYDRWIDIGYFGIHERLTGGSPEDENDVGEPNETSMKKINNPNAVACENQQQPDTVKLIYLPFENPKEPNELTKKLSEPNLVILPKTHAEQPGISNQPDFQNDSNLINFRQIEHPPDPNNILGYQKYEPNLPGEPNMFSDPKQEDPNEIEIILDKGTANLKRNNFLPGSY